MQSQLPGYLPLTFEFLAPFCHGHLVQLGQVSLLLPPLAQHLLAKMYKDVGIKKTYTFVKLTISEYLLLPSRVNSFLFGKERDTKSKTS